MRNERANIAHESPSANEQTETERSAQREREREKEKINASPIFHSLSLFGWMSDCNIFAQVDAFQWRFDHAIELKEEDDDDDHSGNEPKWRKFEHIEPATI